VADFLSLILSDHSQAGRPVEFVKKIAQNVAQPISFFKINAQA
jgi:hypothetical protein